MVTVDQANLEEQLRRWSSYVQGKGAMLRVELVEHVVVVVVFAHTHYNSNTHGGIPAFVTNLREIVGRQCRIYPWAVQGCRIGAQDDKKE